MLDRSFCYALQDSHLSVMGTSKTSKVALGVFSRRTRAGKVADAPRTTSLYSTARRAKQATSTANLPYGDGDETRHLKCQRARGTSHVSRRRSRSQSRSDAPFSSMASTDACSGARARLCSGTSAGVVRRSIAGMKQLGTKGRRMYRQLRYDTVSSSGGARSWGSRGGARCMADARARQ